MKNSIFSVLLCLCLLELCSACTSNLSCDMTPVYAFMKRMQAICAIKTLKDAFHTRHLLVF